jgi:hypothetical protein
MEPKIQSSFIPKKPVAASNRGVTRRRRSLGILTLVAFIIFAASAVFAGGTFFYITYLENTISAKSSELSQIRTSFNVAQVGELLRLDKRMATADTLLGNHLAPSMLFDIFEENTLRTVQFNSLTYALAPETGVAVVVEGVAHSFASVALQSDAYLAEPAIRNATFTGLGLTETGNVRFTLEATLDSGALSYVEGMTPVSQETQPTVSSDGDGQALFVDSQNSTSSTSTPSQ